MHQIYFFPNTFALRKGSEPELKNLAKYLLANPDITIEVQGHTNGNNRILRNRAYRGLGKEWNFEGSAKKLSQYRARSIRQYLESQDIDPARISVKGYGGDRMIVKKPHTMEAAQKNIRVEVWITGNGH